MRPNFISHNKSACKIDRLSWPPPRTERPEFEAKAVCS
jgi:hypothetical protein